MSKKENIDNPSDEQIEAWKKEHGTIYTIEVAEEPESFEVDMVPLEFEELPKLTGYLKKPDRVIMNYALATMNRDMIAAGKAVLKNCWLGGDLRLMTEKGYSETAGMEAIQLVEVYRSRLKKA